jgi:hypothetical protein
MTQTSYDPTAPAAEDTRPLAITLGLGAGCHECGRVTVGFVKVGRNRVWHCEYHAAIVERVARLQLAS